MSPKLARISGLSFVSGLMLAAATACAQGASENSETTSSASEALSPEASEDWSNVPPQVSIDQSGRPSDAIVLFDGTNLDHWKSEKGDIIKWVIEDDVLRVTPDSGDISTVRDFCDVQLHLEWRSPLEELVVDGVDGKGQLWGNSGVFLQSRYEVQILNSYNNETYSNGQAGAIYKQHSPLTNSSLPPGEWQTYDIVFEAPEFGENGELIAPAQLTVFHNGVLIHNDVELQGETVFIGPPSYKPHGCAPLKLQDHWEPVEFRNIWIRELN